MGNYILNDAGYDNTPLEIIDPLRESVINEKELMESIEKNKKIIEQMRNNERYRELVTIQK